MLREAEILKTQTEKENVQAEQTLTSAKRERKRLKKELLALNKLRKKQGALLPCPNTRHGV